jgi:hypothetical protein
MYKGFRTNNDSDNDSDISVSCGGVGCVTTILACVALWALVFGVTVGGKHYGMAGCDSNSGVTIDK